MHYMLLMNGIVMFLCVYMLPAHSVFMCSLLPSLGMRRCDDHGWYMDFIVESISYLRTELSNTGRNGTIFERFSGTDYEQYGRCDAT
jgi:hypothetical protein